jgi:hypothetical protein
MALTINLKATDGTVLTKDMDGKGVKEYPSIMAIGDKLYVIKNVSQDKKSATYHEAVPFNLGEHNG